MARVVGVARAIEMVHDSLKFGEAGLEGSEESNKDGTTTKNTTRGAWKEV